MCIALVLLCAPNYHVRAESTSTSGNVAADESAATTPAQNHNSSRSNRTSPIAIDNVVCDGVTCTDGTCAATLDECSVVNVEAEFQTVESILPSDASSGNTTDANTTTQCSVLDPEDCDDNEELVKPASAGDVTSLEVGEAVDQRQAIEMVETSVATPTGINRNESCDVDHSDDCDDRDVARAPADPVPVSNDADVDGDGLGDLEAVAVSSDADQQLLVPTSTPGNTRNPEANCDGFDADCDGEIDDDLAELGFVSTSDGAANTDSTIYCWGNNTRGVCLTKATSELESNQTRTAVQSISINGADLRSWTQDDRDNWQEHVSNNPQSLVQNIVETFVASSLQSEDTDDIVLHSANIQLAPDDQSSNDDSGSSESLTYSKVELEYDVQSRLFGVVPLQTKMVGRLTNTCQPEISRPWYSFLITTPDTGGITSTLKDTADHLCGTTDHL